MGKVHSSSWGMSRNHDGLGYKEMKTRRGAAKISEFPRVNETLSQSLTSLDAAKAADGPSYIAPDTNHTAIELRCVNRPF